jgi:hypothetical protein
VAETPETMGGTSLGKQRVRSNARNLKGDSLIFYSKRWHRDGGMAEVIEQLLNNRRL